MDTDSNDGTVTESLNGETKPDPTKLAHSAIIKQDVMLSATTTQSPLAPVSSVFTMPSVSLPNASGGTLGLSDHLFMSVPSIADTSTTSSVTDAKSEANGAIHSLSSQTQLLGQPQVAAPQFFLASQAAAQAAAVQGQAAAASAAASSLGVQQLLIPVSTGNGTQQFISIPVSLATGGNQQIQLLTTSNGQIIATNLASLQALAQPLNLGLAGVTAGSVSSPASHHGSSSSSSHAVSSQLAAALPQLLSTGAQGQLLALGTQNAIRGLSLDGKFKFDNQVLTPVSVAQVNNSSASSNQSTAGAAGHSANHSISTSPSLQQTLTQAVGGSTSHTVVAQHSPTRPSALSANPAATSNGLPPSVSQLLPKKSTVSLPLTLSAPKTVLTSNGLPTSISELIPDTVGNSTESTTVDGINLDEIKEFARQFKIRRLSLGLTQTQVGQALSATEGPAYSQSAICRFEKLDITPKSAQKIKPVLERWMLEAEERYKNGVQNLTEFIGSEPSKKRKRRTSFTPQALEILNQYFERNTHPSGAEMTELAEKLNYDREVIRVWFCNKRQALKNTIKKLKQEAP
ncbi:POU domain, class 6, transcription factor 2-like isoform X1 [Haliotis rubra]|uniref:POU domain, class 6, transcription factor 2-like isoform X1 n=2 Tax=Haliotis rubra TaxID=36100 RepID=UPI001EE61A6D|nr:POU domain, class 6, transcription factor 2-like isoform X1 [Haliotis rubra]XP_046577195.1 POU domain, class 6, transcription factor 2-like isoform X1 [Haliotis rubra]XP_046577196.1 POU domain, class 6, transcription factor 2-like isoform X1 [Haliotis rubra]